MHLAIISALLHASTALSAALLPRQANSTSGPSAPFILHSRLTNSSDTTSPYASLGYLHAEYSYGAGYFATLHTAKSDAIEGYLSDAGDAANSSLVFPEGDSGYYQGFVLDPLSETYPTSIAQIFSGQMGTKGVSVDGEGRLGWESVRDGAVDFYACTNWALEWGPATAVGYRWKNATNPASGNSACFDIDLIAEYV